MDKYEAAIANLGTSTDENDEPTHDITQRIPIKARGKFMVQLFKDEDGEWRERIKRVRNVFGDEQKFAFLKSYQIHGLITVAANEAGVTVGTVRKHMETDEDFGMACVEAEELYRDRVIQHHQDLLFNGTTKESYDRNGNIISREKVYPIKLIEMELKKHDKSYTDRKEVDIKVGGGVLVAPAEMTLEQWKEKYGAKEEPKVVEGEVISVSSGKEEDEEEEVEGRTAGSS